MVKSAQFMRKFLRLSAEVERTGDECKRALAAADAATLALLEFVDSQPGFMEEYLAVKGEKAYTDLRTTLAVLRSTIGTRAHNVPQA